MKRRTVNELVLGEELHAQASRRPRELIDHCIWPEVNNQVFACMTHDLWLQAQRAVYFPVQDHIVTQAYDVLHAVLEDPYESV